MSKRAIYISEGTLFWIEEKDAEWRNTIGSNRTTDFVKVTDAKIVPKSKQRCTINGHAVHLFKGDNGISYYRYEDYSMREMTKEETT
jgi:hypothetical protein